MFGLFKEMFRTLFSEPPKDGGYNREWTRGVINPGVKSYQDEEDEMNGRVYSDEYYEEELIEEKEEDILDFDFTKMSTDKQVQEDDTKNK